MFRIDELGISSSLARKAVAKYNDLETQAKMFDMDIDIETWSLVPKSSIKEEPFWLARWKDQVANGDNQAEFNVDME